MGNVRGAAMPGDRHTEGSFWLALGCACFSWLVFLVQCCPTIYWRDGPEFVTTGYTLGVSHPTGSATYALLAKAMTLLPLGSIPFRVNLVSSLCGALAVVATFWIVRTAQERGTPVGTAGGYASVVALLAAFTLAFSRSFWRYAEVAEVYTAEVFWLALLIGIILWVARQEDAAARWRGFLLGALLYGMGLGVHGFLACYLPAFALYVLLTQRRAILRPAPLLVMCFFFLLGFSVYLLLPIRSSADAFFDWGHTQLWQGFLFHVLDWKDVGANLDVPRANLSQQVLTYVRMLPPQVLGGGIVLALFGCGWQFLRDRATWCLFALIIAIHLAFFLRTWTREFGFLPTFLIVILWVGVGLAALVGAIRRASEALRLSLLGTWGARLLCGTVAVSVFFLFLQSRPYADKKSYYAAKRHLRHVFSVIDEGGVLLAKHEWFPSFYLAAVENGRPDVAVLYRRALMLRQRLVAVDPSCFGRLNLPNLPESELDVVKLERFLSGSASLHPFFWEPELDDVLAMHMLRPEGLLYRIVPGLGTKVGPIEIAAHNAALHRVLKSQAAEPSFLTDEEGLYRYAVVITVIGNFFRERGLLGESDLMQRMVTDLLPRYYPGLVLRGILQAQRGELDAAEHTFAEAIAIAPHRPEARLNLSLLYLNNRRYLDAAKELERLLTRARDDPAVHYYLGIAYEALGDQEGSRYHLGEAERLDAHGEFGADARQKLSDLAP